MKPAYYLISPQKKRSDHRKNENHQVKHLNDTKNTVIKMIKNFSFTAPLQDLSNAVKLPFN